MTNKGINIGKEWITQKDNALVRSYIYTNEWLQASEIDVLDWPAKSSDLTFIENVWAMLVRKVYCNGRQ